MAEKVKLSKDGNSIDFVQTDSVPTSMKKFRHSPEIEGFYRFIYENDLQKEAYEILSKIIVERKAKKTEAKIQAKKESKESREQAVKSAMVETKAKAPVLDKKSGPSKAAPKIMKKKT